MTNPRSKPDWSAGLSGSTFETNTPVSAGNRYASMSFRSSGTVIPPTPI